MRVLATFVAAAVVAAGVGLTPASAVPITRSQGNSVDTPGEITGNPAGFVASWSRVRTDVAAFGSIRARQFDPAGTARGKELVFDEQAMGLSDPVAIPLGSGTKVAGFWIRPTVGVVGRIGDTATGKLGAEVVVFDGLAEAYMDVAPLSGGRYAVVGYRFDTNGGIAKRVAVRILGPNLKPISNPAFVPGPAAAYTATAASDFRVVKGPGASAVVVYRNRADGNVYSVTVNSVGKPAARAVRLNQAAMPLGSGGQQASFEVEAARLAGGRLAVVWTRIGSANADDAFDVRFRLATAAGAPVGAERAAPASNREEQVSPEVVALAGGGFAVAWVNNGGPVAGRPRSYVVRRFKANGNPAAAQTVLASGERGVNGPRVEAASTFGRVVLVHAAGSGPIALEGDIDAP